MKYFKKLGKKEKESPDWKNNLAKGMLAGAAASIPAAMFKRTVDPTSTLATDFWKWRGYPTFLGKQLAGFGTGFTVRDWLDKGGYNKIKEKAQKINPFKKNKNE